MPAIPCHMPRLHQPRNSALRKGRVSLPGQIYIITTVVHRRQPVFSRFSVARAAVRGFTRADLLTDTRLLAWVLMPDHVHWLIQLSASDNLPSLVNRLKSASARAANRVLERDGTLWMPAFHDRAVRREEDLRAAARYLVANPLRAGLVTQIGDYPFWDAVWIGDD